MLREKGWEEYIYIYIYIYILKGSSGTCRDEKYNQSLKNKAESIKQQIRHYTGSKVQWVKETAIESVQDEGQKKRLENKWTDY